MRSSERALGFVVAALVTGAAGEARAQGYAVERFVPSAPGAGWFALDDLRIHGGLGGTASLGLGYSHDALRLKGDNGQSFFSVVRDQATADFGLAITYSRYRFYLDLNMPLAVTGHDGMSGGQTFTAPHVSLQTEPDLLADPRVGVDARLYGDPEGPLRLGASAQLIVPSADSADYLSDGTYRAMARLLLAGDKGYFTYAANLGLHIRPHAESDVREAPQGSELLFAAAGGARFTATDSLKFVIGPELWGETAFNSFFGTQTTGLEALVGARLEGSRDHGPQLRIKLGAGAGLNPHFGAPEWRMLFGIEVFNHNEPAAPPTPPPAPDAAPADPPLPVTPPGTLDSAPHP